MVMLVEVPNIQVAGYKYSVVSPLASEQAEMLL